MFGAACSPVCVSTDKGAPEMSCGPPRVAAFHIDNACAADIAIRSSRPGRRGGSKTAACVYIKKEELCADTPTLALGTSPLTLSGAYFQFGMPLSSDSSAAESGQKRKGKIGTRMAAPCCEAITRRRPPLPLPPSFPMILVPLLSTPSHACGQGHVARSLLLKRQAGCCKA